MYVEYLATLLSTVYEVPGDIDPALSFQDLQVDSLSLAELGAQLEDDLGVAIAEEKLTAGTTVAELARLLETSGAVIPA